MMKERKIIHVDMDAFYAAIEQRENPDLKGKPVIVGGMPDSRGVVATASYEARRFGIRSAMPSSRAFRLCPEGVFIRPRFELYGRVSSEIMTILKEYTAKVQQVSIDEAYLDVTINKTDHIYAREIAREIRTRIYDATMLTASAGVAPNKFLAKIASDLQKPDGLTIIHPTKVESFVKKLPVRKVPGIGRVTEEKMKKLGMQTLADIQERTENELTQIFGKYGSWYYRIARGIDEREVTSERIWKSVSCEDTFQTDLVEFAGMENELVNLAERLSRRLKKHDFRGKTITLKVTFSDFRKITRSRTLEEFTNESSRLLAVATSLLHQGVPAGRPVRLLGIGVANLEHLDMPADSGEVKDIQLTFDFDNNGPAF